jgi:hypothetical protein
MDYHTGFWFCFSAKHLTVCVTCVWAGVDNAWEQEKLEARKMLENAAESHTSGARFVGTLLTCKTRRPKKILPPNCRNYCTDF